MVILLISVISGLHHVKCRAGEAQAGIKIARRNINNLRYADDITLLAEIRGTKEPLDENEIGE